MTTTAMPNETSNATPPPPGNGRRGTRWNWLAWLGAALLLCVPLVAMQFTDEVQWSGFDFLAMGVILATACGLWELATRASGEGTYRLAAAIAIVSGFLVTWITLAVGIIGNENDPANLAFFGVLLLAAIGAVVARLRAHGMAMAMLAAAIAQAAAGLYALVLGSPEGVGLCAFFTCAWLAAAALFRSAATRRS